MILTGNKIPQVPNPQLAPVSATIEALNALKEVDFSGMLKSAFEMPSHIIAGFEAAGMLHSGDVPLDRSKLHLVGLGGSAIAGELLRDMMSPVKGISVHRGTRPPRDKAGVLVSSYSGNTREILEISELVIGGLRTVIYLTSGGLLEKRGVESAIPVWKMPSGHKPRAAVGWSMAMVATVLHKWQIAMDVAPKLGIAAAKFQEDIFQCAPFKHPLIQSALPIADSIQSKISVIFHSLRCTGSARRLAGQINENGKQTAFALVMPEAMHNAVEGLIGCGENEKFTLIFIMDVNDSASLQEAIIRTMNYFTNSGFSCLLFPSAGDDPYERTLSRVFIADMVSLFLAARRKIDPTPIPAITSIKELEPPFDKDRYTRDRIEFH